MRPELRTACFVAMVVFGATARAPAAQIEGVVFPDTIAARGTTLRLHRTALLRYRIVFRGYVAALYLPDAVGGDRILDDVPKRLEISYFWPIDAASFRKATTDGIARNVPPLTAGELASRIDQLNQLYTDVKSGDRYALTYVPGAGTELALNGAPRGTVGDADFAAALFAIWFGPEPFDAGLKRTLLDIP